MKIEPMDNLRAGQLLIVLDGPWMQSGAAVNPFTGQVSLGPKVRNQALVGAVFEVLDVSLPFIAVRPRTPIRNSNPTGVIDLRSGIRFKEVTSEFLNHLVPPQQQRPNLGLAPETVIEGVQLQFAMEEQYGATQLKGCEDPNCSVCNPETGDSGTVFIDDMDDEDDCEDDD